MGGGLSKEGNVSTSSSVRMSNKPVRARVKSSLSVKDSNKPTFGVGEGMGSILPYIQRMPRNDLVGRPPSGSKEEGRGLALLEESTVDIVVGPNQLTHYGTADDNQ